MVNWNPYLNSLCKDYAKWQQSYTITDVEGQKRVESEPSPLRFSWNFMVQTVKRDREERGEGHDKVERLTVLEGLRKYASEHVLLIGRPGSGKSTALAMQPLSEAQMQQFVRAYLPQQGEQMLRQLGSRLREFGQTPLLLWMLCSVFVNNSNKIPSNLGSVFRHFTQIYANTLKQAIPTSRNLSRNQSSSK